AAGGPRCAVAAAAPRSDPGLPPGDRSPARRGAVARTAVLLRLLTNPSDEGKTSMRKTPIALAACLLSVGLLAGCGDDTDSSTTPTNTPTSTTTDDGLVINATIRGDEVDPNGERLEAKVGEPITINVDADRAGELHVHSTPEQELEYDKGKTTLHLDPITTP